MLPQESGKGRNEESPIPALVLGSSITALGAVRSLGRSGIPLHVISPAPAFIRASRWYRRPPHGKLLSRVSLLPEYLENLPLERAVLIPTSDHAVLAIADLPADLAKRFPASQASAEVISKLVDKHEFGRLLDKHGVPQPRTIPVKEIDDHCLISDHHVGRFIIKPRDSQAFSERFGVKAFWPSTREELRSLLRKAAAEELQVVLQEYIPGPPTNHYFLDGFYDRNGICRAQLTRRRLRMSPPDFGNSCATISVPPGEAASAASALGRFLSAINYRGPYDAEFKRDERTGGFFLIELNVRPWWQAEFAALCGVDAVAMSHRDALGLPQESVEGYKVGKQWLMPFEDLTTWARMAARGDLNFAAFREFLRSWSQSSWAGYAVDDPLPGVVVSADLLRRAARVMAAKRRRGREALISSLP